MSILYTFLFFISVSVAFSQVGINNSNPSAALDVIGDVVVDEQLYLENPGENTEIRGSKLLIRSTTNDLLEYDINASKYGPVNYVEFAFNDLSTDGLQDYDTKINTTDYVLIIQGYYFLEAGTNDTDIMLNSNTDDDNIEGYQIYAYPNSSTNTWFIRAFVNDSKFKTRFGASFGDTSVDMYLNTVIYRKGFITKTQSNISVDMGDAETGTAPLPSGF